MTEKHSLTVLLLGSRQAGETVLLFTLFSSSLGVKTVIFSFPRTYEAGNMASLAA